MPAGAAQVVGELVRGDGEEVGLQLARFVEVGDAVEEADEGFLHDVFAGRAVAEATFDEGEEPAFIAGNQRLPGAAVAVADLLHQQAVALGAHRTRRSSGVVSHYTEARPRHSLARDPAE